MSINLSLKLDKNLLYVIAVSGGVDSMVLLDVLYHQHINLVVVNFNHLKRLESFQERILIQNYCFNKKITFVYLEIKICSKNFQNEARNLRQKKLIEIASQYQTNYIITAHHLDDLAENIFMKITRGSSLLGYSGGMKPNNIFSGFYFLKPFLYVTKKNIIHYAGVNKIPYLNDDTNFSNVYLRNQFRNQFMVYFKKDFNFLKHIKNFHLQLLEIHEFIRQKSENFLNQHKDYNFDLNLFLTLPLIIQKDIILYLLEIKNLFKNFNLIQQIIKGLNNFLKPNLYWDLSNDWRLVKSYHKFSLLDKKLFLKTISKPVFCRVLFIELITFPYDLFCQINYNQLSFPLKLRHRKLGDVLNFVYGRKKLKSFLIEKKIPLFIRNQLWLIVDNNDEIIWIPKLYINKTLGNQFQFYLILKNNFL